MKAVRYDHFGGVDVLGVRDVATPQPGSGEVLVAVCAAGINPGESSLRSGAMVDMFPSTFPSGQGSDLAGTITQLGAGVTGWAEGDEVLGWVDTRGSHAQYVVVPAGQILAKPASLAWPVAGALFVAGSTAWAAVRAVAPERGEVVVVSGAAGGVGGLAVQLAADRGATVLGIAGDANRSWLEGHGVTPIGYGDGLEATADRIRAAAPGGVAAFIDTIGGGYVDMAVQLGVEPDRIDTVIDFEAVRRHGVQALGSADGANLTDMAELVSRLADGRLELPIAATHPLADVRTAFAELEQRHTHGKVVLIP